MPIPGTTRLEHLEEDLGAVEVELTADDLAEVEDGFASIGVQGARMPEELREAIDAGAMLGTSSVGGQGLSPAKS